MSVSIILDVNEHKLKNHLKNVVEYDIVQLPIGDIMFTKNGKISVIIERKTLSDLASSICGGRWKNQLCRLKKFRDSNPNVKIIYLIEESSSWSKIKKSSLLQAATNVMIRDGLFLLHSGNISDTVKHLIRIRKSLIKYSDGAQTCDSEISTIGKCYKKSNILTNPSEWLKCCISLIPSFGPKSSQIICNKYKTLSSILRSVSDGEFVVKGLGPKKTSTIKQYFI